MLQGIKIEDPDCLAGQAGVTLNHQPFKKKLVLDTWYALGLVPDSTNRFFISFDRGQMKYILTGSSFLLIVYLLDKR